jgi:hypothetical protein
MSSEVPGKLHDVIWSQDPEDISDDGDQDLLITWNVDGELVSWIYSPNGSGFKAVGVYNP